MIYTMIRREDVPVNKPVFVTPTRRSPEINEFIKLDSIVSHQELVRLMGEDYCLWIQEVL